MAGLPVVSSTVGCCAVVACERVPVGDVMALADAVERVHSSKGAWDEAARRSRVAAEGLAVRRHAELLDETYRGGTNCSTLGALRGAVALEEEN